MLDRFLRQGFLVFVALNILGLGAFSVLCNQGDWKPRVCI